ncbi:MAG: chemotaxis protein CheW [Chloroflexota bacterium]|nr:MAG: chemotaxis protein CheW [Chloroflexota bacterium]
MVSPDQVEQLTALDVLLVRLDQEIYALPTASVREVARHRPPTPVPGAPPALPGIINQRGAILPVVDLRLILGLPQALPTRSTRLVVLTHEDVDMALLVDAVLDLATLPPEAFEPAPLALDPARARLIRGVARQEDGHVILLDLSELIAALRDWS